MQNDSTRPAAGNPAPTSATNRADQSALSLFTSLYLALPGEEQDRVYGFAVAAKARAERIAEGDATAERTFAGLFLFGAVVEDLRRGLSEADICGWHGLTAAQFARYRAAWDAVATLHAEFEGDETPPTPLKTPVAHLATNIPAPVNTATLRDDNDETGARALEVYWTAGASSREQVALLRTDQCDFIALVREGFEQEDLATLAALVFGGAE